MTKAGGCSVLLLSALLLLLILVESAAQARSIIPKPQPLSSFKINTTATNSQLSKVLQKPLASFKSTSTQKDGSCSFTVTFTTSCSSPSYTRDQISLAFGDAYGNEVYVPRLDDPSSGAFEACSVDTYDIYGPCTYDVCYLYVYRSGYDGWKLNTVEVYGYNYITFYYNAYIPSDVWYGFDFCNGASAST